MRDGLLFLVLLLVIPFLWRFIDNNVSFIGRYKRLKILFSILISDIISIILIYAIVRACTFTDLATVFIVTVTMILITFGLIVYSIIRAIKTITEGKMEITTLTGCTLTNLGIYSKLSGMSIQGKKNSFNLIFKDRKDFYAAMYNGINSFNIRYFTSSGRIESVTFMPNGISSHNVDRFVEESIQNQEIKKKKRKL